MAVPRRSHIHNNILVLLLSLILLSRQSDALDTESHQQWICTSTYLCLPDPAPDMGEIVRFESQNDCRLSCGKYGAIWPMPTGNCSLGHERVLFDPWKVRFNVVAPSTQAAQFVHETNRIFISNILRECRRNCTLTAGAGKEVLVKTTLNSSNLALNLETDESYKMIIRTTNMATFIDIRAPTAYGARLAFETLSNLITGSNSNGLLLVSQARILDRPVFAHRGLLLDTARNYIPLRQIRSTLDGMAASKLNVLHWHVVDTHSFPLEVPQVPEFQRFGAYSPEHVYSRSDTQNIIKYAKIRGIRVLIEIDGPSHAGNGWQWGPAAGLGNLAVCLNQQPWRSYCIQPPCGQLNPLNDNMYSLMKSLYSYLAEIIPPEETIHMGGDEVHIPCWNSTAEITRGMRDQGYQTNMLGFYKLWAYFHARNLKSWDEVAISNDLTPKSVIIWSSHLTEPEVIEDFLPKERYIVQTWVESSSSLNSALLAKGYRLVISTKDSWYLDHGFWGRTQYYNWIKVYSNSLPEDSQVLGGEVCMWSEYVDENSVESRIWPRAGAAAERLWSNPKTSAVAAQARFYRYRERLIARGVHPDAVTPRWCVLNEGQCL